MPGDRAAEDLQAAQAADRAEAREWELILPRVVRSVRRPVARPVVVLRITERPAALLRRLSAVVGRVRTLTGHSVLVAGLTLLLALGLAAYQSMRPNIPPAGAHPSAAVEMGGSDWIAEWASDPTGAARGRQIALYRPSLGGSDYRLEFLGRIERQSLGWVFRASDASNYYAVKLEANQPGALPAITHFAVVGGVEGPDTQRTLRLAPGADGMWKVGIEARGDTFTVWVQDRIVEEWKDDRLKAGALGFLHEKEEVGQVQSIRISFLDGGHRQ